MNVVGSARLEYFADGPNAGFFVRAIEAVDRLVVPAITCLRSLSASANSVARVMLCRPLRLCSKDRSWIWTVHWH